MRIEGESARERRVKAASRIAFYTGHGDCGGWSSDYVDSDGDTYKNAAEHRGLETACAEPGVIVMKGSSPFPIQ